MKPLPPTIHPSRRPHQGQDGKPTSYVFRALSLLLCLCFVACRQTADNSSPTPPPTAIDKSYTQGALTVRSHLSRSELSVAERLELTLTAVVPENYELLFPPSEEKLGGFKVVEAQQSPPRLLPGGQVETSKRYLLDPFLAGSYTIPPLPVSSRPQGRQEPAPDEIATAEVTITVRSLLPAGEKEAPVGDILPPVAQPYDSRLVLAMAAGAVLLLLLLGWLWRWWRRRPPGRQPPPLPPHTLAYQALDRLLASDLLTRGEVKDFHFAVSDILRRYIEERFALQAPERTTEEFLADLGRLATQAGLIRNEHKMLLKEFLTHCDLVKFAEHRPATAEISRTVALCRQFIQETEPAPVENAPPPPTHVFAQTITAPPKPRGRQFR